MGKLAIRLGLACALALNCQWVYGETPAAAPQVRPRICLVLSGGGARGMAHIGVLKVLEELKIPIDCIAGTSMGAVVGGTFAAGTLPSRMEEVVLQADWDEIFRDRPPRDASTRCSISAMRR